MAREFNIFLISRLFSILHPLFVHSSSTLRPVIIHSGIGEVYDGPDNFEDVVFIRKVRRMQKTFL
jgi:transketolase C-terminal domain/subunit